MEIHRKSLPEQHYLYVERSASFEGSEISEAMGSGFGEVYGFTESKGIERLSMPSSIYMEMPSGNTMTFRAAIFVSPEDAAKADGNVKAGVMPAGDVLMATHVGPYASMNQTHKAMWDHSDEQGLAKAMPVWEIYVDDPTTVSEAELRTDVYHAIG